MHTGEFSLNPNPPRPVIVHFMAFGTKPTVLFSLVISFMLVLLTGQSAAVGNISTVKHNVCAKNELA